MRSGILQWFEFLLFYLLTLEMHGKKSVGLDRTSCRQTCLLYIRTHICTLVHGVDRPLARFVLRSFSKQSRAHNLTCMYIHVYTGMYLISLGLGCYCRYMDVCMRMYMRNHHARFSGFISMSTNGEDFNTEASYISELSYQRKMSRTIIEIDSICSPTTFRKYLG